MSKKGGYLIIDLKNKDLASITDETFTKNEIKEMCEIIEKNYHKNILVTGITINQIEKNDCMTTVHKYYESEALAYAFKLYGINIAILNLGDIYTISNSKTGMNKMTGTTDTNGVIKINEKDFIYSDNLYIAIQHSTGVIAVKYNVVVGDIFRQYVIYNDGTVKIVLDAEAGQGYYTLTVTGGTVNGLNYELYYLG